MCILKPSHILIGHQSLGQKFYSVRLAGQRGSHLKPAACNHASQGQEILSKAEGILKDLSVRFGSSEMPPIFEADLICETPEQEQTLRDIVSQTKVVLTCSGPFQSIVKLWLSYVPN